MTNDYIRRQDAIEVINQGRLTKLIEADVVESGLKNLPAADVVPVVHGRWLPIVSYNNTYKCSECGRLLVNITDGLNMVAKHYPYCHCGAKMDGKKRK